MAQSTSAPEAKDRALLAVGRPIERGRKRDFWVITEARLGKVFLATALLSSSREHATIPCTGIHPCAGMLSKNFSASIVRHTFTGIGAAAMGMNFDRTA